MQASLVLDSGEQFEGQSFGYNGSTSGELVFNTGMVGYFESITDPSYSGQILTFTYPLIGNYGVFSDLVKNKISQHFESSKILLKGVIVSSHCNGYSHHKAVESLADWLTKNKIPALYGIDTRVLTKIIRGSETVLAKIVINNKDVDFYDPNKENLVATASINEKEFIDSKGSKTVVLVDSGAKNNIIRTLIEKKINLLKVPWDHDYSKEECDGVFLTNGPGNPVLLTKAIDNLKKQLKKSKPIFGICLGHQLLAQAAGAKTFKMKFGHRSLNQPCIEVDTGKVYITSQNHGYAVDASTLDKDWQPWFYNANDKTNEGIKHKSKPFFSVQFHPEAYPGPSDSEELFDRFIDAL